MIALRNKTVAHTFLPLFKNKKNYWDPGPVVQTLDSAIHRINLYPTDTAIDFRNTYPLDRDLSGR